MSEFDAPVPPAPTTASAPPPAGAPVAPPPAPAAPAPVSGPIGKVRGTGGCIGLAIVTLGIYTLYWYYKTHEEMKQHTGQGLGGAIALIIAFFVGVVSPFLNSGEVGNLYKRAGQEEPVTALTGLWYIPGIFILVGPIVWFVKTNGALNRYWESQGATA